MVGLQLCLPPRVGGIFPYGGGESCRDGRALPGKVMIRGRCPKTCCFPSLARVSCSALAPRSLQKEVFGLESLLPLQHILNVSGLRSLQEGTFLPKAGALLFWVVHGVPGNQHRSPTDHQGARMGRSF